MKTWLALTVLAVVAAGSSSCTNDGLDDGSSADVILEVLALTNPAIQGQLTAGVCNITVTDWTARLLAAPKNVAAVPPFNDVALVDVTISYDWVDGANSTPTRTFGLGDTIIPAQASSTVNFTPIALDDILNLALPATGELTLTFRARTVEGTTITDTVQRTLSVSCRSSS
jgi:hypothetical protein